jgi:hypothetical protein
VGSLLVPHLALLQGDTQSRGLPPVRCASAGAERPEGGLRADPAYVVISQEKKKKRRWLLSVIGRLINFAVLIEHSVRKLHLVVVVVAR